MSKRIVLSGYYGFGNTGDEAVLAGILATFQELGLDARITVLSADPERTKREHPGVESVHRYKLAPMISAIRSADLVISGGGSLLQDATSARSAYYYIFVLRLAQMLRRKTMIYAQGIGPLIRDGVKKSVAGALNRANMITVRDKDSKSLLESIGVNRPPIEVTADPSFVFKPDFEQADKILAENGISGEFIAVSLRPWTNPACVEAATQGIAQAGKELGVKLIIIPMQETEDAELSNLIDGGITLRGINDVRIIKGIIARSGLMAGMRLHSLIFAASEMVPCVPIVYDPKVASFAEISKQTGSIDIDSATPQNVKAAVISAWQKRDELNARLIENMPPLRQLALKSGELAQDLLK